MDKTVTELSDSQIITRVSAGEKSAFAELIRRYQPRLRSVLAIHFISANEIEEHLQDAFVQAFMHLRSYDSNAPFFPWLKMIALNSLRMEMRRLQSSRRRSIDYLRYLQLTRLERDPEGTEAQSRSDALHDCMQKLPPDDSVLLESKYGGGLSLNHLAEKFASTEGALKQRLMRLRNALRLCIQKKLFSAEQHSDAAI